MNIHFNLFSHYAISLFKERLVPALNTQQKKILAIASLALGFLAACYVIKHCCFQAKSLKTPKDEVEERIAKLIAQADNYAASNSKLDQYIATILKDPEFQKDAYTYMKDWREKRGKTEELRHPEDAALNFFEFIG